MRLLRNRTCLPWIVLVGLLCWGCSDDSTTETKDAAADRATAVDAGPEAATPDAKQVTEAAVPDIWDADAGAPDMDTADAGPAPGFPPNVTQFVNMGDSIAVGVGATSGNAYKQLLMKNNDTKYPSFKGKDLSSRFSGISVVDTSVGGAISSGLVSQLSSLKGNPKGDTLVVISIGGNDFAANLMSIVMNPAATKTLGTQVTGNLKKVVTHFSDKKLYPGKVMILMFLVHDPTDGMGTLPAGYTGLVGFCTLIATLGGFVGPTVLKQLGVFNSYLKSFAATNKMLIVDNATAFLGHSYHYKNTKAKHYNAKDPTLWFYNDCLHLNDRGNHELRKLVWKRITGK